PLPPAARPAVAVHFALLPSPGQSVGSFGERTVRGGRGLGALRRAGKGQRERGAAAGSVARRRDRAAMRVSEVLRDRQAQPGAAAGASAVGLVEPLEDPLELVG